MKKLSYESPAVETVDIAMEMAILSNKVQSVQQMEEVDGEWDEEDF